MCSDLRPYSWLISISLFWWPLRANIFFTTWHILRTLRRQVKHWFIKRRVSRVGQSYAMKVIQGTNLAKKLIPPQTTKPGYPRHLLWAAHPPNGSKQKRISHRCYMWGEEIGMSQSHFFFYCPEIWNTALNSWKINMYFLFRVPKIIPADAASHEKVRLH